MAITLDHFARLAKAVPIVVHSLEQALYQVTVLTETGEQLLVTKDGRALRSRNLQSLRATLQGMPVASATLRHQSPYDEMIGQPLREAANTMEVPLAWEQGEPPVRH